MGFDEQAAYRFSVSDDRDIAPFFAGRRREIRKFDDALDGLTPDRRATVFRIYQGAPGCGKTSLLNHLREHHAGEALFVKVGREDLRSMDTLAACVRAAFVSALSERSQVAIQAGTELAHRLKLGDLIDKVGATYTAKAARKNKLVLYMDEAQRIQPSESDGLVELHTNGLGFPSVLLLTGLGYTADGLSKAGVSRLSDEAVTNMGAMSDYECAESTAKMLRKHGAVGSDGGRQRAAETVAKLSRGWPQHLYGAQKALCRELLRTNGVLERVDWDRVRLGSDRTRRDYYNARLSNTVLDMVPAATARIVDKMIEIRPGRMFEVEGVCEEVIAGMGLDKDPKFRTNAEEFAKALVERGVLGINPDGQYDVAIPSMLEYMTAMSRPA